MNAKAQACSRKRGYLTIDAAARDADAIAHKQGDVMAVYRCPFWDCRKYHVGHVNGRSANVVYQTEGWVSNKEQNVVDLSGIFMAAEAEVERFANNLRDAKASLKDMTLTIAVEGGATLQATVTGR